MTIQIIFFIALRNDVILIYRCNCFKIVTKSKLISELKYIKHSFIKLTYAFRLLDMRLRHDLHIPLSIT